jgi:DME family drug/metabolite transporter
VSERSSTAGRLALLGAAVLFSTGGAAIKATSLDGLAVASLRSAFAALAFVVLSVAGRGARGAKRPFAPDGLTLGVSCAYAATMTLFVLATKWTTAANAIFLQASAPLFVAPLAYLVLGERIRRFDLILMVALVFGMGLFFAGARAPLATAPAPLSGNVAASVCALVWSLTLVGLRRLEAEDGDAARATFLPGNLIVALGCGALARFDGGISALDWGIVAYLGIVQIALGYELLALGLARVPTFEASLLLLLEPPLNALWAYLVHGEPVTPLALAGALVVLVATWIGALGRAGAPRAGMSA